MSILVDLWPYLAAAVLALAAVLGLTRRGRLNERGDVARDTAERVEKGRKAAANASVSGKTPTEIARENDDRWR